MGVSVIGERLSAGFADICGQLAAGTVVSVGIPPGAFALRAAELPGTGSGLFGDNLATVPAEYGVADKGIGAETVAKTV